MGATRWRHGAAREAMMASGICRSWGFFGWANEGPGEERVRGRRLTRRREVSCTPWLNPGDNSGR